MDVEEHIGYYKNVVPDALCKSIMNNDTTFNHQHMQIIKVRLLTVMNVY